MAASSPPWFVIATGADQMLARTLYFDPLQTRPPSRIASASDLAADRA